MTSLGTLPGGMVSVANGINSSGQIVGYSGANSAQTRAFAYSNGTMTDIGTLPGGNTANALAINNSGQIVGNSEVVGNLSYHAFLYDNGVMNDLGTLPGDLNSLAFGINDSGEIVGFSQDAAGVYHAFLYDGTMTDLGTLGLGYSQAYGINNNGHIVGRADTVNGFSNDSRAFLVENGTMHDLNQLLDSSGTGWTLMSAQAINSNGWIVGLGASPDIDVHAFLLTPVPEPSSFVLCSLALLGYVATRRASRAVSR